MTKTAVVITCSHSTPEVSNERFDWLGSFLYDLRPDLFIDLGDRADMKSLNTYDTRYPQRIVSQSYEKDIAHCLDADERLWRKFRSNNKRMPYRVGFEGNHENRIKRAISHEPRLEGKTYGISFDHLQNKRTFDEYHEYVDGAPALVDIEGVAFGHYVQSGAFGAALSSKHHAHALVERLSCSVVVGHSHQLHYYRKADARPRPISGLVAGCFKGGKETWAGQSNNSWSYGVNILRNLEGGDYDFQWVSMDALRKEYGE